MLKTSVQLFWWLPWYRCSLSVSGPIAYPPLLPQCTYLMLQKTTWEIACISHISSAFHHSRILNICCFVLFWKTINRPQLFCEIWGCVLLPLFWGLLRRWDHNSRSGSPAPFKSFFWLKPFLLPSLKCNVGPTHLEASDLGRDIGHKAQPASGKSAGTSLTAGRSRSSCCYPACFWSISLPSLTGHQTTVASQREIFLCHLSTPFALKR